MPLPTAMRHTPRRCGVDDRSPSLCGEGNHAESGLSFSDSNSDGNRTARWERSVTGQTLPMIQHAYATHCELSRSQIIGAVPFFDAAKTHAQLLHDGD